MRDGHGAKESEEESELLGGGGGMEQLIGAVHRLSVASLASMATADRKSAEDQVISKEFHKHKLQYSVICLLCAEGQSVHNKSAHMSQHRYYLRVEAASQFRIL